MEARTREIRNERRDSGAEVDALCLSDCLGQRVGRETEADVMDGVKG